MFKEQSDQMKKCTKLELGKSISINNKLKREVSEYKDTIENLRSSQVNSEEISKNYASISEDMHNILVYSIGRYFFKGSFEVPSG